MGGEAGIAEVQGEGRPRHVRDHDVEGRAVHPGHPHARVEARRQAGHREGDEVRVVGQGAGPDRLVVSLAVGSAFVAQPQAPDRIGLVGGQPHQHGRDLIAHGSPLVLLADRDRRHRHQRLRREIALALEVTPQRPPAQGQHHVVDGDPGNRRLDPLDPVEGHESASPHAMRSDRHVEPGAGSPEGHGRELGALQSPEGPGLDDRFAGAAEQVGELQGLQDIAARLRQQLPIGRRELRLPRLRWRGRRRIGLEGQEGAQDLRPRAPVDAGVMHLGDDREGAGAKAEDVVEALDEGHLPQRPRAVEGLGEHVGGELRQLPPASGPRQRHVVQVEVEVEIGVFDPAGAPEVEGNGDEPLPEGPRHVEPRCHDLAVSLQIEGAAADPGLEEEHSTDVHGGVARLEVEERRVEARQLLHRPAGPWLGILARMTRCDRALAGPSSV